MLGRPPPLPLHCPPTRGSGRDQGARPGPPRPPRGRPCGGTDPAGCVDQPLLGGRAVALPLWWCPGGWHLMPGPLCFLPQLPLHWHGGHWGPWMHPPNTHTPQATRWTRSVLASLLLEPTGSGREEGRHVNRAGAGSGAPYCRGQGFGEGAADHPAGVAGPSPWLAQPPWGPRSWTLLGGGLRNLPRNSSIWPELWEMHKLSLGWTCPRAAASLGQDPWGDPESSRSAPATSSHVEHVRGGHISSGREVLAGWAHPGGSGEEAGATPHPAALCGLRPSLPSTRVLPSPLAPLAGSPAMGPAPPCVFTCFSRV